MPKLFLRLDIADLPGLYQVSAWSTSGDEHVLGAIVCTDSGVQSLSISSSTGTLSFEVSTARSDMNPPTINLLMQQMTLL